MKRPPLRTFVFLSMAGAAILALLYARGVVQRRAAATDVPVAAVGPRDIAVTIDATGTVEPIDLVEVKSKASGQIVKMPVQVGSMVKAGDLLAQIDPRDVKNQYDQAFAALHAAQAKVDISQAQKRRADDLFGQQVITTDEHESATLDFANAQAALVTAKTNLDLARQRLDDATVRAPVGGTILEQDVSDGQVIASATATASGGTTLLKMADLSRIRLRALVDESDIGNVRPGQNATVTVEAFPQRTFRGQVEKIEPQAVVQQSVTMFPVLISITNEDRSLLPGMNGEVSMLVDQRSQVLAVPVDAVRSVRELPVVASALGMNADSLRAQVDRQIQERMSERRALGLDGDSSGARLAWRRSRGPGADSTRGGFGRGSRGGGMGGGRGRWGADSSGARTGGNRGGMAGGGFGGSGNAGSVSGGGGRAGRAQVVLIKNGTGFEPRIVRLGISDFDYSEVLGGLKEGDQVALLSVAELQAKRKQDQSRMRQRMGGGMPGVPGGGGGGGGGGRRGGGT